MKPHELQFDSWVYNIKDVDKKPFQVKKIGKSYVMNKDGGYLDLSYIRPISLNAEFFKKNGFEHGNKCRDVDFDGHDKDFRYCILGADKGFNICIDGKLTVSGNIQYVHEFQLILSLCKIKKKIIV